MNEWQFQQHFSDGSGTYERLAFLGDFELDIEHGYQHTEAYYPGGSYESSLEGPLSGIAKCNLVFKVLPNSEMQSILLSNNQGEQTLALYLFEFFQRHNSPAKKPFLCPHPLTEADTLWRFVDNRISMKNLAARLWSTGLALVEHKNLDAEPFTNLQDNPNGI
jgi:hypothetical protein